MVRLLIAKSPKQKLSHVGNEESYSFDKVHALELAKQMQDKDGRINCSQICKKYPISSVHSGKIVGNQSQVMKSVLLKNGFERKDFPNMPRSRLTKKKVGEISIPMPRPVSSIVKDICEKTKSGDLVIGNVMQIHF